MEVVLLLQLMALVVSTSMGSAAVFDPAEYGDGPADTANTPPETTFDSLRKRKCLPPGFKESDFESVIEVCGFDMSNHAIGMSGSEWPGCVSVRLRIPLVFNCAADRSGQFDDNAMKFDSSALEKIMRNVTAEPTWKESRKDLMAICKRASSASLTPRQLALYTLLCFRWSLYAQCDYIQDAQEKLDDEGKRRRAQFLSGDCPTSPSRLLDAYGLVSSRSWTECSKELPTGDSAAQLYKAGISRIACLLSGYKSTSGNVDFAKLLNAIGNGAEADVSGSSYLLNQQVDQCAGEMKAGKMIYKMMTPEEFVKCWASHGVFSCATQEANQVASTFPDSCKPETKS